LDDVFADLTNQDADPEPEQDPEPMENTHANEALELLDVGNDRESSAPVPDGEVENRPQEVNSQPEPEVEATAAA
jgi:histone demethylase JARID1